MAERGRPTEYDPDVTPKLASVLARQGLTNAEIAQELGIAERTFYLWLDAYPDFVHKVNEGKDAIDLRVEQALLSRALGYTLKLKKEIALAGPAGSGSELVEATFDQHVPADPGSIMNWLANRQGTKWRQKPEVDPGTESRLNIVLTTGPTDESNIEIHLPQKVENKD